MSPHSREALERAQSAAARPAGWKDPKGWARDAVRRFEAGESLPVLRVREAHLALGLPVPRGCRA